MAPSKKSPVARQGLRSRPCPEETAPSNQEIDAYGKSLESCDLRQAAAQEQTVQETYRKPSGPEVDTNYHYSSMELSRIQDDWCWEIWLGKAFGFMNCGGCFRRTIASNFSNCNSLAAATHHFGTNWAWPSTIARWIRRCGWIIFHLFWLQCFESPAGPAISVLFLFLHFLHRHKRNIRFMLQDKFQSEYPSDHLRTWGKGHPCETDKTRSACHPVGICALQ